MYPLCCAVNWQVCAYCNINASLCVEKGGREVAWLVCQACQWESQDLGLHPVSRAQEGTQLISSTADMNPCAQWNGGRLNQP